MSNKAVSVYAEAIKRQQEEQVSPSPIVSQRDMVSDANAAQHAPRATDNTTLQRQTPTPIFTASTSSPTFAVEQPTQTAVKETNTYKDGDSKLASLLSGNHDSSIEFLRNSVRFAGKEAFYGRFTSEEKRFLKEIAYTYQVNGVKTNENEISRIAVNLLLHDYKEQGQQSILARVLQAIHN
jgi:hypothetical protein